MQQKICNADKRTHWPYTAWKCIFCKRAIVKGEEMLTHTGNDPIAMHRWCLETFLDKHPAKSGAIPPRKVAELQKVEEEFEALRNKLLKTHKPAAKRKPIRRPVAKKVAVKAKPAAARKPRSKP